MERFYHEDQAAGVLLECDSEAEALAGAEESLRHYRRDARADGEWSPDVSGIVVGRVVPDAPDEDDRHVPTHQATETGDERAGYDYAMRPVPAPGASPGIGPG